MRGLTVILLLAATGCGPLDGLRTARYVSGLYDQYEVDMRTLSVLEQRGSTSGVRNAAQSYRTALAARSTSLVVDSAIEFSTQHGGEGRGKINGLESLFANQEVARSKLLLAATDFSSGHRSASLSCLHDYGLCTEQREDTAMACNSRLLSCLADALTESHDVRGVSDR